MKYKVGDKVRIVNHRTPSMNENGGMDHWLGKAMTIRAIDEPWYRMEEDKKENGLEKGWWWRDTDIDGLAAEHVEWEVEYCEDSLRAGYKVRLRPLSECIARDEHSIWVEPMNVYAEKEVVIRDVGNHHFNIEGTKWNFPYGAIESIVGRGGKRKKKLSHKGIKKGDKVLLKPLEFCRKTRLWVSSMDKLAGTVVTVDKVSEKEFHIIEGWYVSYEAIEEIIGTEPSPMPTDTFKLLFGFE